jgi:hypothetical protein
MLSDINHIITILEAYLVTNNLSLDNTVQDTAEIMSSENMLSY